MTDKDSYYGHALYYKKFCGSSVYLPVLNNDWKDNPPIIGKPKFIIVDSHGARWANHYEADALLAKDPALVDKTIFDFTSDPDILAKVIGFDPNDQERRLLYIRTAHPTKKQLILSIRPY